MDDISQLMEALLWKYSDDELNRLVWELWVAEAFSRLLFEWLEGEEIKQIKMYLDEESRMNWLSEKLNDSINFKRAKLIFDFWKSLTIGKDDRFWVNLEILLAYFCFTFSSNNPRELLEEVMQQELQKSENKEIAEFLVRTPEEYFKVLVYHLKLTQLSELREIFECIERNKQAILDAGGLYTWYLSYRYHRVYFDAPTEFFCAISPQRLEYFFQTFQIASAKDFQRFFLETDFMFALILNGNPNLLDYFKTKNKIQNGDEFIGFVKNSERRSLLLDISRYEYTYVQNVVCLLDYFSLDDIDDAQVYANGIPFLKTISTPNLQFLLDIFHPADIDELHTSLTPLATQEMKQVDYSLLRELEWVLGIKISDALLQRMVLEKYTLSVSESIQKLITYIRELWSSQGNIGQYILFLFQYGNDIEGSIDALLHLIERLSDTLLSGAYKYIDFRRLDLLSDFMWGTITSYLGYEILSTWNVEETLQAWQKIIDSFSKGEFDTTQELHINLEYKRFRELSQKEEIAKYMRSKFNFSAYTSIFKPKDSARFNKHEQFELECLLYEAELLKEYIWEVNTKAKELWKKLWIVPNLSYGYLPVTAIQEDLWDANIEIVMWIKVWSTESHSNREVLNAGLFQEKYREIMSEQPIILVVDGTSHLVSREWNGKEARYPDAYQWYLNQVIAFNHAFGYNEKEKVDYSDAGKTPHDIERLFENWEFKRLTEICRNLRCDIPGYYDFRLWNTAWMDLILRAQRQKIQSVENFQASDIRGATMIFCNVWILQEQLPIWLKQKKMRHYPAFFDDSGRIIDYEYSCNQYWVYVVNSIEEELKRIKHTLKNKE